ncbi:MAG TPA: CAP domain-containing protein [Minicystis sp.]|nr:CAP domain-containing protein [Minicystis sp.]
MGTRVLVVAALVAATGCAPLGAERGERSRVPGQAAHPVTPAPAVAVAPVQASVRGTAWTLAGLYPSMDGAGNDPFPGLQIPPWLLPKPPGKQGSNPQQWQIPIPWSAIPLPPGWAQPAPQPQPKTQPQPSPAPSAQPGWSLPGWTLPVSPAPGAGDWPSNWAQLEAQVLAETNVRRARGATCGSQSFGPAGPLAPNAALQQAARAHSKDMATRNYFDHVSPEGVNPEQRTRAAGFKGSGMGENIAAGDRTAAAVVNGWMNSPGHCVNIMDPHYKSLGVGYAEGAGSYHTYWTQDFGN